MSRYNGMILLMVLIFIQVFTLIGLSIFHNALISKSISQLEWSQWRAGWGAQ